MTYYTEADLAEMFGVDEPTITKWRRQYDWPHLKMGRRVRFTEAAVVEIEGRHHVAGERVRSLPGQTSRSAARSA